MRVLLISTNQLKPTKSISWQPVVPLGLAYIAASLRNAGHEIKLLDLCFNENPESAISESVDTFRPEAIGISFRNIEMMAYFNNISFIENLREIVTICRNLTKTRIVLGGSGFSVMPESILRYTGLDLGIIGEGEESMLKLLAGFERNRDYHDVPGLIWIKDGKTHITPPSYSRKMEDLPVPARDLIDHESYLKAGGTANLQTKRGCPFQCIYCTYPIIEGKNVRCRPAKKVMEEFRLIYQQMGIKYAYIVDNQFNHPPDHARSICEELIDLRNEIKVWWSCMLNPGAINNELAFLLKAARCHMVDLSIDSGSDTMLKNLGKNFSTLEIRNAVTLLKENRLSFTTWILFGGPGETKDTVKETLNLLADLEIPNVIFSIGLRVCPQTRLKQVQRDEGKIRETADLLKPIFYLSMDADEIVDITKPYLREHPDWRIAALELPDNGTSQ